MHKLTALTRFVALLTPLWLAACASQIPLNIREVPPGNPSLDVVSGNTGAFRSQQVRWGGDILETENRENATLLTILARPLTDTGKPEDTDSTPGRFIARIPQFLDPKVYKAERSVTVRGTLRDSETRQVGQYAYNYPVVEATDWYLWPVEIVYPPDYYYPWWYDPWYYDPWYRYPYYYPRNYKKDKQQ